MVNKSIDEYEEYLLESIEEAEEKVSLKFHDIQLREFHKSEVRKLKHSLLHLMKFRQDI